MKEMIRCSVGEKVSGHNGINILKIEHYSWNIFARGRTKGRTRQADRQTGRQTDGQGGGGERGREVDDRLRWVWVSHGEGYMLHDGPPTSIGVWCCESGAESLRRTLSFKHGLIPLATSYFDGSLRRRC